MTFIRLIDGSVLEKQNDGTFIPIATHTDWSRLAGLSDDEIDSVAASDPDHPALDDAFFDQAAIQRTATIEVDADVIDFFRKDGRPDQRHINTVLRDYVTAHRAARS